MVINTFDKMETCVLLIVGTFAFKWLLPQISSLPYTQGLDGLILLTPSSICHGDEAEFMIIPRKSWYAVVIFGPFTSSEHDLNMHMIFSIIFDDMRYMK